MKKTSVPLLLAKMEGRASTIGQVLLLLLLLVLLLLVPPSSATRVDARVVTPGTNAKQVETFFN